jgi:hypothetical protein
MEYIFKKEVPVSIEIDFDKLVEIIRIKNPGIKSKVIEIEFMTNIGYYVAELIGYDPYEIYHDVDAVMENIMDDFKAYLKETTIK